MKKIYIVANWKSNMISSEAKSWLEGFNSQDLELSNKEVVICPPFTLLPLASAEVKNRQLGIKIGAQNISPFDEGAFTGEINGKQIKEYADYVIIGHSERRKNFTENDEVLFKKVESAINHDLIPIFCIQGKEDRIPSNIDIAAYEPINAIGTGHPDTPENAEDVASFLKSTYNVKHVLYGGSVTSGNVQEYTQMPSIDGALIGGASLDAQEFCTIIKNA